MCSERTHAKACSMNIRVDQELELGNGFVPVTWLKCMLFSEFGRTRARVVRTSKFVYATEGNQPFKVQAK